MKVTVNIDCTPDEARQFLGLPDVSELQKAVMKQLQAQLEDNIRNLDPEQLARIWMPMGMNPGPAAGFQGWADLQRNFWNHMTNPSSPMGRSAPRESFHADDTDPDSPRSGTAPRSPRTARPRR